MIKNLILILLISLSCVAFEVIFNVIENTIRYYKKIKQFDYLGLTSVGYSSIWMFIMGLISTILLFIVTIFIPFQYYFIPIYFLISFIIISTIEFLFSLFLEKHFIKMWDYSNEFCNIQGRVSLLRSIGFGILGLFIMTVFYIFRG
jgi:uncharacterized membrane protein